LFSFNRLLDLVELSISLRFHSVSVNSILDIFDGLFTFLGFYQALHLYSLDFSLGLGMDALLLALGLGLLFSDIHLLGSNLEFGLLRLNVLVVGHQGLRDMRLGHSNCDDLDTRRPDVAILLQAFHELLIQVIELIDEYLL